MSRIQTVSMPEIGEGVAEGEVIEWLKKVGESVQQDEPIVSVMTDKATVELPAPTPGKLVKQHYQPGQMAQRDQPLYDLEVEGEIEERPEKIRVAKPLEKVVFKQTPPQGVLATPQIRKMARQLGIDLTEVKGTGKEGQITSADLKKLIGTTLASIPKLEGDQEKPLVGIRHQMALEMSQAHTAIPHFSYFEQAEATRLIQLKDYIKEEGLQEGLHVTFMPLFIRALSLTLQRFPEVNSSYDAAHHSLLLHAPHNIGIAFSTKAGLIVPVLKNVEQQTLSEIVHNFALLKEKVEQQKLQPQEMKEATITISNYGILEGGKGGLFATPIIHYPEVAILAIAKIQKQPLTKQGQVVVSDVVNLSWSFDHRVIDGALAAAFSHHFCLLIQNPAQLL